MTIWQRNHPPRCPDGWHTGAPDFVGIGCQRAGTSWWFDLLVQHPQVSPAVRPKELHFLMKLRADPSRRDEWYRFFPRPPGSIAGEFTPAYILPPGPAVLAEVAPVAKVIVLVRDPVDRLESAITMEARRRGAGLTLEILSSAERRSRYSELIEYTYRHFAPDQVHVLQYEQCVADTPGQLARTHAFLGIDAGHVPPGFDRPVNQTRSQKLRLSDSERAELVERLWPDIQRLPDLVPGVDLSLWKTTMRFAPDRVPAAPGSEPAVPAPGD